MYNITSCFLYIKRVANYSNPNNFIIRKINSKKQTVLMKIMDYSISTNKEEPQGGNHYEGDSTRILSMFFQIDAEYSGRTNH